MELSWRHRATRRPCPNERSVIQDHRHLDWHAICARYRWTRFELSPHSVMSSQVVWVWAYSLSNILIRARWITSESNPAEAPSWQQWLDASATRAPCEENLATQPRVASPQTCAAITTHSARAQRDHWRPLLTGGLGCAGSGFSELRQKHRDLHDMVPYEVVSTATRRLARLPPCGLLRPHVLPKQIKDGRHLVVDDQPLRVSKWRTTHATLTQSSSSMEEGRSKLRSAALPSFGRHDGHRSPCQLMKESNDDRDSSTLLSHVSMS